MKIIGKIILCVFLSCYSLVTSSQSVSKNSIGLQLNPFFDEHLFNHEFYSPVYAFRYTLDIREHITLGPELSGFYTKAYVNDFTLSNFNVGGFFRYSFLPTSRVNPYIEVSPYYTFHSWKNGPTESFTGVLEPSGSRSYLSGYIAPGISLYSKSKKVSLDLFYKFSNKNFANDKKSVLSYRLNFKF